MHAIYDADHHPISDEDLQQGASNVEVISAVIPRHISEMAWRRAPTVVQSAFTTLARVRDPWVRAQLYLAVADGLAARKDPPHHFSLSQKGLLRPAAIETLVRAIAAETTPPKAAAEGLDDEPAVTDKGRAMVMARLVQLSQMATTPALLRSVVATIAGLPEFSGEGVSPAEREDRTQRLQKVIFDVFAHAGLYILDADMRHSALTAQQISDAVEVRRKTLEQEALSSGSGDRKGLNRREEADVTAQLVAYEAHLRRDGHLTPLPLPWLTLELRDELVREGLAAAGLAERQ